MNVYFYDPVEKVIYPTVEGYIPEGQKHYIVGPVNQAVASEGEMQYWLIARGWDTRIPLPTLGEDPIPF
jgi:hypothetical protein